MGLPKGAKQVVLDEVTVTDVRVENLLAGLDAHEIHCEGFNHLRWSDESWAAWWARSHQYTDVPAWTPGSQSFALWKREARAALADIECRRIEWEYDPESSLIDQITDEQW